jgi:hypothetical protein
MQRNFSLKSGYEIRWYPHLLPSRMSAFRTT